MIGKQFDKDRAFNARAEALAAAWKKYRDGFGEEPHGTVIQMAALMSFLPDSFFTVPPVAASGETPRTDAAILSASAPMEKRWRPHTEKPVPDEPTTAIIAGFDNDGPDNDAYLWGIGMWHKGEWKDEESGEVIKPPFFWLLESEVLAGLSLPAAPLTERPDTGGKK